MSRIDLEIDDVLMAGVSLSAIHIKAPVSWKARFAAGIEKGWVQREKLPRVLSCFRETPGARLSQKVLRIPNIQEILANVANLAPSDNDEHDLGWGKLIIPNHFSQNLLELPIIGFSGNNPVYEIPPLDGNFSITDLSAVNASSYMGSLYPKTPAAKKKFKEKVEKLWGGDSVLDALFNFPRTYRSLSQFRRVDLTKEGQEEAIVFELDSMSLTSTLRGVEMFIVRGFIGEQKEPFETAIFGDYFEQKSALSSCDKGDKIIAVGRVAEYKGRVSLKSPWMMPLELFSEKMLPIYSGSTKMKVSPMYARKLTQAASGKFIRGITDPLPDWLLSKRKLTSRKDAYQMIHNPKDWKDQNVARKRIAYDELIRLQVYLEQVKKNTEASITPILEKHVTECQEWIKTLPYKLTGDQKNALRDIVGDFQSGKAMRRLVMGDVGVGKTLVAMAAALMIVSSGRQVAVMAPNSVLANQLGKEFSELPLNVVTLSGSVSTKKNAPIIEKIKQGKANIIVGTHSLLSETIEWNNLGLIIVDEQHKFGVEQREKLLKNRDAHFMNMTATPIPASIASTLHGDLSISTIRELPPGRKPIKTTWVQATGEQIVGEKNHPVWEAVALEILKGNRVYIISTLVEPSEDRISVESTAKKLENVFPGSIGILHGKMKNSDKDKAIAEFKNGEKPILVASSVVEVGVNVPEATMEIILDATRFGLASLHQLRGRVGRGSESSSCILVGVPSVSNPESSEERMKAMVSFSSGFDIAEADFKIRGEGEFFGSSQSGKSDLKLVSLQKDKQLLQMAQEDVLALDEATKLVLLSELNILHR